MGNLDGLSFSFVKQSVCVSVGVNKDRKVSPMVSHPPSGFSITRNLLIQAVLFDLARDNRSEPSVAFGCRDWSFRLSLIMFNFSGLSSVALSLIAVLDLLSFGGNIFICRLWAQLEVYSNQYG